MAPSHEQHGEILQAVYAAFNRRDTDAALALMREDVSWPKASEGGRVVGKGEIRAYWTRQWAEFDPHVEPFALAAGAAADTVHVRVHQVVRSLGGELLFDGEVEHVYRIEGGLIASMQLGGAGAEAGPAAGFTR